MHAADQNDSVTMLLAVQPHLPIWFHRHARLQGVGRMPWSVLASTSVLISVHAAVLQALLQQHGVCLAEHAFDMLQGGARCPALPLGLCPRLWDERHIPSRDADDAAIYGAGLARKQNWPAWLLVR